MSTTQAELDSLNTAIKTEQDGRAFYQEAAQRATNPLAKSVFETLADEELIHIDTIRAFYDSLKETGSCDGLEQKLEKIDPESRARNVFEKARQRMDDELAADAGSLQAYEKAMDFEQAAYDMYQRLVGETSDDMARQLYEFMLDQENQHYAFLKETHDYLNNPGDWFAQQEKPHFEG